MSMDILIRTLHILTVFLFSFAIAPPSQAAMSLPERRENIEKLRALVDQMTAWNASELVKSSGRRRAAALDSVVAKEAFTTLDADAGTDLSTLISLRLVGRYANPADLFDLILQDPPERAGTGKADAWARVLQMTSEILPTLEERDQRDLVKARLRALDDRLALVADLGSEKEHLRLGAVLAHARSIAWYRNPLEQIDRVMTRSGPNGPPQEARIALTEAFLRMNLLHDAFTLSRTLDPQDPVARRVLRGSMYAKQVERTLRNCVDHSVEGILRTDADVKLGWLLATSATQGYPDYIALAAQSDQTGETLGGISDIQDFCENRKATGRWADWAGLFDPSHRPPIDGGEHILHASIPPKSLARLALPAHLLKSLQAAADRSTRPAGTGGQSSPPFSDLVKLLSARAILASMQKMVEWEGPKSVSVVTAHRIADTAVLHIRGGDGFGAEFLMLIRTHGDPQPPFVLPLLGHERGVDFADVTGDNIEEIIVQTHATTGRYLNIDVIDVQRAVTFSIGEPDNLYHGQVRVTNLTGAQQPEIVVAAMHEARLLHDCNQCPGQYSFYVYHYERDRDTLVLRGRYDTAAQTRDPQGGGLVGVNLGGALSFTMEDHQKVLQTLDASKFTAQDATKVESLVGEAMETAASLYNVGDTGRGEEFGRRVLARLEALRRLGPWVPVLIAKTRLMWAEMQRYAGESAKALMTLDSADVDVARREKRLPGARLALVKALAAFDVGDLTAAYSQHDLLMRSESSELQNLTEYAWFLASIGDRNEAASLANRIIEQAFDPSAMVLAATLLRERGSDGRAIRLLAFALAEARQAGDSETVADVFLEAARFATEQENHALAERFLVAALFESPTGWWNRNGAELLVALGRNVHSQGNPTLARRIWEAATRVGSKTDSRVRSQAFYELAQLSSGGERFAALSSAYDAATRHRIRVPGEHRKLEYVGSTDLIADAYFSESLGAEVPADDLLEALEKWRFQVFNELYHRGSNLSGFPSTSMLRSLIHKQLDPEDALVVYYIGAKVSFAIVADNKSSRLVKLALDPADLTKRILKVRSYFEVGLPDVERMVKRDQIPSGLQNELETLHNLLIAPLGVAPTTRRLIFVPDRTLHSVPWPALSERSEGIIDLILNKLGYGRLHPLAARFEVNVLPSSILLDGKAGGEIRSAALIASTSGLAAEALPKGLSTNERETLDGGTLKSLPDTETEVLKAAELLHLVEPDLALTIFKDDGSVRTQTGVAHLSSLDELLVQMTNKNLIHIAAHGIHNAKLPMSSFLLMDAKGDGRFIRASDFLKVDLSTAELVVLSACRTGNVIVPAGNEVLGFSRALFGAGAKRIILTSWLVEDRVSLEYVTNLYEGLRSSRNVRAAHRIAISMLIDKYSHPYYWAGYVLSSRE